MHCSMKAYAMTLKLSISQLLLYRNGVARFETVMDLRNYLEQLGTMEGANKDEKGTSMLLFTPFIMR